MEELADYLIGKDPLRIEHHWQHIYRAAFFRGGPVLLTALSGIDQALWVLPLFVVDNSGVLKAGAASVPRSGSKSLLPYRSPTVPLGCRSQFFASGSHRTCLRERMHT